MALAVISLLNQTTRQLDSTDAVTLIAGSGVNVEITRILVCNTTGSTATFSLYHATGGSTTYDNTNILYQQQSVNAGATFVIEAQAPGTGIAVGRNDNIGIQASVADALTVSVYGASSRTTERTNG